MKKFFFGIGLIIVSSCSSTPSITQKLVPFNDERIQLTQQYMREHYAYEDERIEITPSMVVVHWTAIPTFEGSYKAFVSPTLPSSRTAIIKAGNLNVSAHYLIDREGGIFQLVPDTIMARHTIGLNHCAIGIENVGSDAEPLNKKQLRSNRWLIEYLSEKYPIDYVIGHHEYTLFKNHPLWKEKDDNYQTYKVDPGDKFMNKLRKKLKSLHLKDIPQK
ncbi:MAG: peptidoglycan recognition protein family protein [Cyclobacteriaceae bacterium]|nr:peptidoglycan recognition protein family protein [Cyclobacteriaceae bacterium]